MDCASLDVVSLALEYPEPGVRDALRSAVFRPEDAGPRLASALEELRSWLDRTPPHEAEEAYTRLFDLSPVCTLHCGYHLFGDAYQRGALLAGLSAELRLAAVPVREGELPDHLPALLRLAGRLPEGEPRALLVDFVVLPALARMNAALAESPSPWAGVLAALSAPVARLGAGLEAPEFGAGPVPEPEEALLHA